MDKITYRSKAGDMDIPAFVFPAAETARGDKGPSRYRLGPREHSRGISTSTTFRTSAKPPPRANIVIAPEYRGSLGYGREFYDAIDYGGNEVDECGDRAADVLKAKYPQVDPSRIGIIGWSHGGDDSRCCRSSGTRRCSSRR